MVIAQVATGLDQAVLDITIVVFKTAWSTTNIVQDDLWTHIFL